MKIFGYGPADITRLYRAGANKDKLQRSGAGASPGGDTLQISQEGKALQTFKAVLKDMPLVREDLVEDIKSQINKGAYKPDAGKIAEGIIRERLLDEEV
ncbi:anti-sigma-28 factor [Desulfocucumis palustris]|uniref:Negative regulator of flagellin synthesis n=1 Tax=Desulfocucumis palustris TaxID=1898651 RepID=A0A2L2X7W1_9FIRM|nr:flagellar biosynthesis anti-sigma factor FlgM [Desulfocucumis palustris]GBF32279.1 anti-sigma-28 factor [Desulfocucumis palustris]